MNPVPTLQELLERSSDPDNPPADVIRALLFRAHRIGVVGLSRDPMKASRRVPSYLAAKGFEVLAVNPHAHRLLGRPAYPDLDSLPGRLDIVMIFRPGGEAAQVVDDALRRKDKPALWLPEGVRADEAAARARAQGRVVVQDLCAFKAYRSLVT